MSQPRPPIWPKCPQDCIGYMIQIKGNYDCVICGYKVPKDFNGGRSLTEKHQLWLLENGGSNPSGSISGYKHDE